MLPLPWSLGARSCRSRPSGFFWLGAGRVPPIASASSQAPSTIPPIAACGAGSWGSAWAVLPADDDAKRAAQACPRRSGDWRFYPQHCAQQMLDNGDLWVKFDGFGYAFVNPVRKVSFNSAATIQYNQDFKCAEDNAIYAYFDTRAVQQSAFDLRTTENPVANLVQGLVQRVCRQLRPADGLWQTRPGLHGDPGRRWQRRFRLGPLAPGPAAGARDGCAWEQQGALGESADRSARQRA